MALKMIKALGIVSSSGMYSNIDDAGKHKYISESINHDLIEEEAPRKSSFMYKNG